MSMGRKGSSKLWEYKRASRAKVVICVCVKHCLSEHQSSMIGKGVIPNIETGAGSWPRGERAALCMRKSLEICGVFHKYDWKEFLSPSLSRIEVQSQSRGFKNMNCDFVWCLGELKSQWMNSWFVFGLNFCCLVFEK